MSEEREQKKEYGVIGIFAHVDAGKTTLSERILFESGVIRRTGRVDNGDAYLDTDAMEKQRGITIYAKQAVFPAISGGTDRLYTLLDTPGHADFQTETERVMAVLDAAVLLISAPDGVTARVRLLFELLTHYGVPVFFFINKMDQIKEEEARILRQEELLKEIGGKLTPQAVPFAGPVEEALADPDTAEKIALCSDDEALVEKVLLGEPVTAEEARGLVGERKLFPVFFGSALRGEGIRELLFGLDALFPVKAYPSAPFGARVVMIRRDESGERETLVKITKGRLSVRDAVTYLPAENGENEQTEEETGEMAPVTEKVSGIRLRSGEKYTALREAVPGMVVSLTGLTGTYAGQGLGDEEGEIMSLLRPVVQWELLLPAGTDPFMAYRKLQPLEEEEPLLSLTFDERKKALYVRLMGEVQREIFADRVEKRCGFAIRYGRPSVIYLETIREKVEGVGHFEPLRHYAEVHLLLEPLPEGSGLVFEDHCPPDLLPGKYRRQVIEVLGRRRHRGVLTGAAVTDMRVSLIAGKAHEKHTEGGDFRQAAYRALRQGLMMAQNVLLEPWYEFELTLPSGRVGRALGDLSGMGAAFRSPELSGDGTRALIRGEAPVRRMDSYGEEVTAYTAGEGTLILRPGPYRPCKDADEVIEEAGYDPEADLSQPPDSVFCSHGAGTVIPWYAVRDYMHLDTGVMDAESAARSRESLPGGRKPKEDTRSFAERERAGMAAEAELMAIFERTYGPVRARAGEAEEFGAEGVRGADRRRGDHRGWSQRSRAEARGVQMTGSAGSTPRDDPAGNDAANAALYSTEKARYAQKKGKGAPSAQYLLVDGYNIIYAWEDLREMAAKDVKAARDRLMDILANYAGYARERVILVFDAYRVPGGEERIEQYHTLSVVFTKEAETADQYIEKAAHELRKQYAVRVATSDAVEQMIIYGTGAVRLSARDLLAELLWAESAMREKIADEVRVRDGRLHTTLADKVSAALTGNAEA